MIKKTPGRILLALVALASLVVIGVSISKISAPDIEPPVFIAHAGGEINREIYTNSLEALNENYNKGFRFFEMDFSWTADEELVAIHDWQGALRSKFIPLEDVGVPTLARFLELKMKKGLTQLTLEHVLSWAKDKGDVFIITDVKKDNMKALLKIQKDFKDFGKYIIPQVYSYSEYQKVVELGYKNIILTVYKMKINPPELLEFAKLNSPFAITMPWQIAQSGLSSLLKKSSTVVYAHTVNDRRLFDSLKQRGVYGIYTDYIAPTIN